MDAAVIWRRPRIVLFLLFLIVGFIVYSRVVLEAGFLFDDFEYVVGNPIVEDLSTLVKNFSDPRQIGYLSFALNFLVGQAAPEGYHLVNVVIHIVNAWLVFLLAGHLFALAGLVRSEDAYDQAFLLPAAAGLLFLVHPLQTQAVSYVTQRFTSLAALCYLASIVAYLAARRKMLNDLPRRRVLLWYGASFGAALCAMKVKEISFTLPIAIIILEMLFFHAREKDRRTSFYLLIPLVLTLAIIPLSLFAPDWGLMDKGVGIAETTRLLKIEDLTQRSPLEYFATQMRVLVIYLRLIVVPYPQLAVYDLHASRTLFEPWALLSLLVHLALAAAAVLLWRRSKTALPHRAPLLKVMALGIGWFYLAASVESSVIPIKDLIFEHRAYLPGVGIILALVAAFALVLTGSGEWTVHRARQMSFTIVAVAFVLGTVAFVRNIVWLNEMNFWEDVVQKIPDKAIGYHNRANALAREGKYELALQDINTTISLFERYIGTELTWENADFTQDNMAKSFMNRASVYRAMGDWAKADADMVTARKMVSSPPIRLEARRARADLYYRRGAFQHAIEEYNAILDWFPNDVKALNDRGNTYSQHGNYKEATADFDRAIVQDPTWPLPYYNRGIVHYRKGDMQKAIGDLQTACSLGFENACEDVKIVQAGKKPS